MKKTLFLYSIILLMPWMSFGAKPDVGAVAIFGPKNGFCGQSQDVKVKVHNFDVITISSFIVNWAVNGLLQKPFFWKGSLSGGSDTIIDLGNANFAALKNDIRSYVDTVNGGIAPSVDTVKYNGIQPSVLANFNFSHNCLNDTTRFSDSSSTFSGTITKYTWGFGNGKTDTIKAPINVYNKTGKYDVKLKVTNSSGCTDSVDKIVGIDSVSAKFIIGIPDLYGHVEFTASDTFLKSYIWDFDDLTYGNGSKLIHQYFSGGRYHVKLSVKNYNNCEANYTDSVLVLSCAGVGLKDQVLFNLECNPNPFSSSTEMVYTIETPSELKLEILDILGRNVATLADGFQTAGQHNFTWNAGENKAGVYFLRMRVGERVEVKRLEVIR